MFVSPNFTLRAMTNAPVSLNTGVLSAHAVAAFKTNAAAKIISFFMSLLLKNFIILQG